MKKNKDHNILKTELVSIIDFLKQTQGYWDREIIYDYPNYKTPFKESWITHLSRLDLRSLYAFQRIEPIANLPGDLRDLCAHVENLQRVDRIKVYPEALPQLAYQFMTEKKKHEISQVVGFLAEQNLLPSSESVIDFCGGAGYLGRMLASYFDCQCVSVDIDSSLQDRGRSRAEKLKSGISKSLKFVKADVLDHIDVLGKSLPQRSNTIGVHTCAHLSDLQFELSTKLNSQWIFNVSCCYFKTNDPRYTFSQIAKQSNFELSRESLLVAARGHDTDFESFEYAMHVKRYRYLLHMFMRDVLGEDFIAMGGLRKKDYAKSFSEYAAERLETVLNLKITQAELVAFEADRVNKTMVNEMIACNSFRTLFSRLVEKYIALDRAVYLSELSYDVRIFEIFDSRVSPRNIGILAKNDLL